MKRLFFAALTVFITAGVAAAASPWGINAHVPSRRDFDYMEKLGVGWVRMDFDWSGMEPHAKGGYHWEAHDRAVAEADARGIRIFATISYTPEWARRGGGHNEPPVNPSDWDDFVYECVSRYSSSISHWGMWNEPNLPEFWTGTMRQYVYDILIPGARAVRAADPSAKVLGPELSDKGRLYTREFLSYVLENAGDYVDIITQHAYGSPGAVFSFMDGQVLPLVQELAPGTDLWLTEIGSRSDLDGESYQAAFYREICRGVLERGYIRKVFFYELVDYPGHEKWGILTEDYRKKEAFHAYRGEIAGEPYMADCFVAGAVLPAGARELDVFYRLRDEFLARSLPGRLFVTAYYRCGPRIAAAVGGNRLFSSVVRGNLRAAAFLLRAVFPPGA